MARCVSIHPLPSMGTARRPLCRRKPTMRILLLSKDKLFHLCEKVLQLKIPISSNVFHHCYSNIKRARNIFKYIQSIDSMFSSMLIKSLSPSHPLVSRVRSRNGATPPPFPPFVERDTKQRHQFRCTRCEKQRDT